MSTEKPVERDSTIENGTGRLARGLERLEKKKMSSSQWTWVGIFIKNGKYDTSD